MKGGVRLYVTKQYIRKELTLRRGGVKLYKTEHQKRIDLDEGWCATLHYITIPQTELTLMKGGVRIVLCVS